MRGSSRVLHFLLAVSVHVMIAETVIFAFRFSLHFVCLFFFCDVLLCFVIYCLRDADYGMFAHHLSSQYNRNYNSECGIVL